MRTTAAGQDNATESFTFERSPQPLPLPESFWRGTYKYSIERGVGDAAAALINFYIH